MYRQATLARPPDGPISDKLATLRRLLQSGLEFHGDDSGYSTHDLHAFAAKFPPQLPALFIRNLTEPGETVLDPMMGSGTAVVEAALSGRHVIGLDIDPLAVKLCRVKTRPIRDDLLLTRLAETIAACAEESVGTPEVEAALAARFGAKTRAFIDYWFLPRTQRELVALLLSIDRAVMSLEDAALREAVREFMQVVLSSIIITKSGGVSRARDLAHSRPHLDRDKVPKDAIQQFRARARNNVRSLKTLVPLPPDGVFLERGDARNTIGLLDDSSVRLVVTSPPYANAIDYMRAHKFSLVWLGFTIEALSDLRATYIGSERMQTNLEGMPLPEQVELVITAVAERDRKQASVLRRYFNDMREVMREVNRVLMPDSAAVLIVGPSTMRGVRVDAAHCLAAVAESVTPPLSVAGIGHRRLDRDRRMMPAWNQAGAHSQIEQRMHEEHVLALYKPPA